MDISKALKLLGKIAGSGLDAQLCRLDNTAEACFATGHGPYIRAEVVTPSLGGEFTAIVNRRDLQVVASPGAEYSRDGTRLVVKNGRKRAALAILADEEYASLPPFAETDDGITKPIDDWMQLLNAVRYATDPDNDQPRFGGVHVGTDYTSATDGVMIAIGPPAEEDLGLFPVHMMEFLAVLEQIDPTLSVTVTKTATRFRIAAQDKDGNVVLRADASMVTSGLPDWRTINVPEATQTIVVDAHSLAVTVENATSLRSYSKHIVTLLPKEDEIVASTETDTGLCEDSASASATGDLAPFSVQYKRLLAALGQYDGELVMTVGSRFRPVVMVGKLADGRQLTTYLMQTV